MDLRQMPLDLLERFKQRGLEIDEEVRRSLRIPSNRYYSVVVYPLNLAGRVIVDRERVVHSKKLSKSDS